VSSFSREVGTAQAAAERAQLCISALNPTGLDRKQKRALALLRNRLSEAVSGIPKGFDTPVQTVYSATRLALSQIDKLESGSLDGQQKALLSEAGTALREADDALAPAFWHN
jgi:hypothetical protein